MSRILPNIAGLFVITLGLLACKESPLTPCCGQPAFYYIIGQVTDSTTGKLVSGVTVEVGGQYNSPDSANVTDAEGKYKVNNVGHTITAVLRGYSTYSANLDNLSRTSNITYNISISPGSASDTTPPPPPLTGKISPAINHIVWYPPADVTDVAGYTIYRNNVAIRTTSYNAAWDQSVTAGTPICYSVSTFDASGNESQLSGEMCATSLSCGTGSGPYDIDLLIVSSANIELDWLSDSLWPHNIYRDGILIKSLAAGENSTGSDSPYYVSYSDTNFSANTKYCYSVTAVKSSGEAAPCPGICITTWP